MTNGYLAQQSAIEQGLNALGAVCMNFRKEVTADKADFILVMNPLGIEATGNSAFVSSCEDNAKIVKALRDQADAIEASMTTMEIPKKTILHR